MYDFFLSSEEKLPKITALAFIFVKNELQIIAYHNKETRVHEKCENGFVFFGHFESNSEYILHSPLILNAPSVQSLKITN